MIDSAQALAALETEVNRARSLAVVFGDIAEIAKWAFLPTEPQWEFVTTQITVIVAATQVTKAEWRVARALKKGGKKLSDRLAEYGADLSSELKHKGGWAELINADLAVKIQAIIDGESGEKDEKADDDSKKKRKAKSEVADKDKKEKKGPKVKDESDKKKSKKK